MDKNFSDRRRRSTARRAVRRKEENPKNDGFFIRVYVCVILSALCLAMSTMKSEKALELKKRLNDAVSENITAEEARQIGEMCMEKIAGLKNGAETPNK